MKRTKRLSTLGSKMKRTYVASLVVGFVLLVISPSLYSQAIPPFKVSGKDRTCVSILVPKETTNVQVNNLVFKFRKARKEGYLAKLIPPTTPGGARGDYAIVLVHIFSNSEWATEKKLRTYYGDVEPSREFKKGFDNNVRGYYSYSMFGDKEVGRLGFISMETGKTKGYKDLFNYADDIPATPYKKEYYSSKEKIVIGKCIKVGNEWIRIFELDDSDWENVGDDIKKLLGESAWKNKSDGCGILLIGKGTKRKLIHVTKSGKVTSY